MKSVTFPRRKDSPRDRRLDPSVVTVASMCLSPSAVCVCEGRGLEFREEPSLGNELERVLT